MRHDWDTKTTDNSFHWNEFEAVSRLNECTEASDSILRCIKVYYPTSKSKSETDLLVSPYEIILTDQLYRSFWYLLPYSIFCYNMNEWVIRNHGSKCSLTCVYIKLQIEDWLLIGCQWLRSPYDCKSVSIVSAITILTSVLILI